MVITVASGKGGAGKTAVATSLAYVMENSVYVDMDAEEPNGHIILNPVIEKEEDFCLPVPSIDAAKCTLCGKCSESCRYGAIAVMARTKKTLFFRELCHSCGVCSRVCPEKAITEENAVKGKVRFGKTAAGHGFIDGILNVSEPSPTRMLSFINERIKKDYAGKNVVIDAPPGAACMAVEAVKGADFVIVVAEPTLFSLNDAKILIELIREMGKDFSIVINKSGESDHIITDYASGSGIGISGKIPFSMKTGEGYSEGRPLIELGLEKEIEGIYCSIKKQAVKT